LTQGGFLTFIDQSYPDRTTFGVTYYFLIAVNILNGYWQQVKFQVNYEFRNHPDSTNPSTDAYARDLLIAQMTARYEKTLANEFEFLEC